MGLFNWFRWQLERRTMQLRIDSLVGDLNQLIQEVTELRIASHRTQLLLHDAERGAKLAAEEQDKLKTQLELAQSASAYWETQAKQKQDRIEVFGATIEKLRDEIKLCRHQANTLTNVNESTEPAETELERLAREIYIHTTDMSGDLLNPVDAFEMAINFIKYRDRKRNEQETQNNGPF